MSVYAVKNDKGEWLYSDEYIDWVDQLSLASFYDTFEEANDDIEVWELSNAYAVELAEAPTKVVVTQEEADNLERAKVYGNPADVILALAANHHPDDAEHILRAYVIGWTVEKPKRYLLPMPDGTLDELDQGKYVAIRETGGIWHSSEYRHDITKQAELEYFFVTQADIDAAPDWVKAITPVEVTDDEI